MPLAHSKTVGSSTAARIIGCPRSYRMSENLPNKESDYAAEGTLCHNAMEAILDGKVDDDKDVIGFEYEAEDGTVHTLTDDLYYEMIEPAMAAFDSLFDDRFEFLVERRVSYPNIEGAFGTADIIGQTDSYSVVLDWKFGRGVGVEVKENKQLLFCASAARHDFPDMFEHEKIFGVIVQPGFSHEPQVWQFTHAEIDAFEKDLDAAWACIDDTAIPQREGDYCIFCPAQALCPAKHEKIKKVQQLNLKRQKGEPTNEHVESHDLAVLLPLAEDALEWAKAVKKMAHEELERGTEIEGWKLVPKRATRSWGDEDEAATALRNMRMKKDELYPVKLISPAQAEKWVKANSSTKRAKTIRAKKLDELIVSHSSGTTLAPVSDSREAVGDTKSKLTKLKGLKA